MEKDYEEFIDRLREALVRELEISENQVYFRPKGGKYTKQCDKLFVEFPDEGDRKNVCAIRLNHLYTDWSQGLPMREIVERIRGEVAYARKTGFFEKARTLSDYEKVRTELFIRLLNEEQYREELKECVYQKVGDIALVLYFRIGEAQGSIASMKVPKGYLEEWGMEEEEVFKKALINTYQQTPPRIYFWERLVYDPEYRGEEFMEHRPEFRPYRGVKGNCLSTVLRTNGAVAVFLPGVARRLSELIGQDLYLVFTSIHEVMVHGVDKTRPEDLKQILADTIEKATPKEDFLTYQIYSYSRERDEIFMVEETSFGAGV